MSIHLIASMTGWKQGAWTMFW